MERTKYIVFGSEHYNPLGIIRSLGEEGICVDAVIIKGPRPLASKSKYINKLWIVDNLEQGYQLIIDKYADVNEKKFLLTGGDNTTSFLDMHYDEIKDYFFFQNANEQGRITYFMDKNNINQLAIKHGFKVLKTYLTPKGVIPENIVYPVITKSSSSNAGGKSDVFICNNDDELLEAFKQITSEEVLIQKYIKKKNELCLDGLSVNKGQDVIVTMGTDYKYILADSYSQYMNMFTYKDENVLEKIRGMLAEIMYDGIFTVEFLRDQDDELYFLEVNLRNSGWSYASTCVGMNLPMIWSKAMVDGKIDKKVLKDIPNGCTAMADLDDFRVRVRRQKMNIIKWFREFRKCTVVFYYNSKDKMPLISFLFHRIF